MALMMSMEEKSERIAVEQAAFDAMREDLLKEHEGDVVLMHGGVILGFFDDLTAAFNKGVARFGINDPFLVSRVEPANHAPVSLAWAAGLM